MSINEYYNFEVLLTYNSLFIITISIIKSTVSSLLPIISINNPIEWDYNNFS